MQGNRSCSVEQRKGWLADEMSFDRGSEEREDVAMLLAAGFDRRQHRLHEAAAAGRHGHCQTKGKYPPDGVTRSSAPPGEDEQNSTKPAHTVLRW
jgi:hypothetical protein